MTRLLCLPRIIAADEAARYFGRPRLRNLYGLLVPTVRVAREDDPASRVPPFVECLWMPAFAIRIQSITKNSAKSVWTSVDGWVGECSILDCADALAELDVPEQHLSPKLDEVAAVKAARAGLLRYILAQRGQMNKPTVGEVEEIRLYHYPVWVYFYRRAGRYLDIKVLDACTGKSAGAKVRVAVLNALVGARKASEGRES